jgi:hypothetical protein
MSLGGGGGGGPTETKVTSTSNLPEYVQPYFERLLQRSEGRKHTRVSTLWWSTTSILLA